MTINQVFKHLESSNWEDTDVIAAIPDLGLRMLVIQYVRAYKHDMKVGIHPRIDPELDMIGSELSELGIDVPHWKIPCYIEDIYI